ncbi:hypothetical protein MBLNU230_g7127t1 [Neophaeotheca triangularis]
MATEEPVTLRIALDWTPNTLHSGLILALKRRLYQARNLNVLLLPPDPAYTTTPARKLERNEADLAICPSESCIAYAEAGKTHLQAIYALLQREGASAIVALEDNERVKRVGDLGNGAVYGSYAARYEDGIVEYMVRKDGGESKGMRVDQGKRKLGLFDAVKKGEVDATWVFVPWEGVEAEEEGVGLRVWGVEEGGVPYGYSPVVVRKVEEGGEGGLSADVLRRFVEATREGYGIAMGEAGAGAGVLEDLIEPPKSLEFLGKSQERINGFYGDGSERLGLMERERWVRWLDWLRGQGMLGKELDVDKLFTNEFNVA